MGFACPLLTAYVTVCLLVTRDAGRLSPELALMSVDLKTVQIQESRRKEPAHGLRSASFCHPGPVRLPP